MTVNITRRSAAACLLLASMGVLVPAHAGTSSSSWSQGLHARARLIAGDTTGPGPWHAGIEIKLDHGFKTYWRTPGSSGVPPVFDFSQSKNLKSADVRFPAPTVFEDGGGVSNGYKDTVIFPLSIQPIDAARPVELMMRIDYAVCEKLCIPVQASGSLVLEKGMTGQGSEDLVRFEARVPRAVPLGASASPAIASIEKIDEMNFIVMVRTTPGAETFLFAEGISGWYFETQGGEGQDAQRRFRLSMVEKPADAKQDAKPLLLTIVTPERAIETAFDLATLDKH